MHGVFSCSKFAPGRALNCVRHSAGVAAEKHEGARRTYDKRVFGGTEH